MYQFKSWLLSHNIGITKTGAHCFRNNKMCYIWQQMCVLSHCFSFTSVVFATLIWFTADVTDLHPCEGFLQFEHEGNGRRGELCVQVHTGNGHRILTVERGSCEEPRDTPAVSTPAVSTPPRLPPLCPSASQHPEVPSRAATATAQTPRLPMSVYLRGKAKTQHRQGDLLCWPTAVWEIKQLYNLERSQTVYRSILCLSYNTETLIVLLPIWLNEPCQGCVVKYYHATLSVNLHASVVILISCKQICAEMHFIDFLKTCNLLCFFQRLKHHINKPTHLRADSYSYVQTPRNDVRARTQLHTTNTVHQRTRVEHSTLHSCVNIKARTDGDNYERYKGQRKSFDVNKETTLWSREWRSAAQELQILTPGINLAAVKQTHTHTNLLERYTHIILPVFSQIMPVSFGEIINKGVLKGNCTSFKG